MTFGAMWFTDERANIFEGLGVDERREKRRRWAPRLLPEFLIFAFAVNGVYTCFPNMDCANFLLPLNSGSRINTEDALEFLYI